MGIAFSTSPHSDKESLLKMSYYIVEKTVEAYCTYQLPPIVDENGYKFFIMTGFHELKDDALAREISRAYWDVFRDDQNS